MANSLSLSLSLSLPSKVDYNECFKWCLCNSWGWIVILPHSKRPDVATGWSVFKRRRTEQDPAQLGSCSCLRRWQATKTKAERCHCPHSSSQRRIGGQKYSNKRTQKEGGSPEMPTRSPRRSIKTNQSIFYFMPVRNKVILDKVLGEGEQVMSKMDKIVARIVHRNLPLGCT